MGSHRVSRRVTAARTRKCINQHPSSPRLYRMADDATFRSSLFSAANVFRFEVSKKGLSSHRGYVNPFKAPKPLPILISSKFVPQKVSSCRGVKEPHSVRKCFSHEVIPLHSTRHSKSPPSGRDLFLTPKPPISVENPPSMTECLPREVLLGACYTSA